MLKASTLFYSVVISLVIAVISGSMILISSLSTGAFQRSLSTRELEMNAVSGMNLLLSKQSVVNEDEEKIIDLFGNGTDSVFLSKRFWGAFEISISKAIRNGKEVIKIAETGSPPDSINNYCLYVPEQDKQLTVCGKTKIKGLVFLPENGVKKGYIEGQNYTGNSLIYGEIKASPKALPEFNKALLERITMFSKYAISETIAPEYQENSSGEITNSFLAAPLIIHSNSLINLNENFSGHIAFISNTQVIIEPQTELNDVIIYAPKVLIKSGFRGNIQVFASDSIVLQENVVLNYPSVLGLIQNEKEKGVSAIILSDNDTISGSIFSYNGPVLIPMKSSLISISEKAQVNGMIYTDRYADIKGTIFGSLMCRNILLRTPSSVYENHFLNAVIDRTELSQYYVGIDLIDESRIKGIVKWLK